MRNPLIWQDRRLADKAGKVVGWAGKASADREWDPVGWADRVSAEADQAIDLHKWPVPISRDLMQDHIGWEGRPLSGQKGDPGQDPDMDRRIVGPHSDRCSNVLGNSSGIMDSRTAIGRLISKDQITLGWLTVQGLKVLGNSTGIMDHRIVIGRLISKDQITLGRHMVQGLNILGNSTGIMDHRTVIGRLIMKDLNVLSSALKPFLNDWTQTMTIN
jgi:hypothetical protein